MIEALLGFLKIYLVTGIVVAVPFAFFGAKKVDPAAAEGTWGFKLLIIPGAVALWPLMLKRWVGGHHPMESSRHRCAVHREGNDGVME